MSKEIKLSKGLITIVDDEDFDWLNQWKWHAAKHGKSFYAERTVGGRRNKRKMSMHRLLLGIDGTNDERYGDHKDLNTLNNQKNNLRIATKRQNSYNIHKYDNCSSIYKGVSLMRQNNKWKAYIVFDNKQHHLGLFDNETAAAIAYDKAAKQFAGEFAKLNF